MLFFESLRLSVLAPVQKGPLERVEAAKVTMWVPTSRRYGTFEVTGQAKKDFGLRGERVRLLHR